ncbi:hypothetical protein [Spirosoma litoris]
MSTGTGKRAKPLCYGTSGLSPEARKHSQLWLFTQRQQGLMAPETTTNNNRNALPLHPCLVGLPAFLTGEHPVTRR